MQGDRYFDYASFMAAKQVYDEISAAPEVKHVPPNSPAYPFAPTEDDETGGPTTANVQIDALAAKDAIITTMWPPETVPSPAIPTWKINQ
jgi:hypothetical protein